MNVTPHVAQNTSGRSSAIDGRTTRHGGYAVSQRIRKRIEEALGWIKTVAGQEKSRFRGRDRVGWAFTFAAAAYNLVRLPKLIVARHHGCCPKYAIHIEQKLDGPSSFEPIQFDCFIRSFRSRSDWRSKSRTHFANSLS
jgi:hypothetical protein